MNTLKEIHNTHIYKLSNFPETILISKTLKLYKNNSNAKLDFF